jgi:CRP-like cAMP-binding protein
MIVAKRPANRLLVALPSNDKRRFLESCNEVRLELGEVLCESGRRILHVYFPLDGFISLVTTVDDVSKLEVGIVGNEGMLGVSLVLGVQISPQKALVQGAGLALRMDIPSFRRHCRNSESLRRGLNRYIYVLMGQLAQTAACTHYHSVQPRLARWLLMTRDRAHSDRFRITHEFLAYMLGVRRAGITLAAGGLQERNLITYSRGEIAIRDGTGLEEASCGCYRQGNEMYERVMGCRAASRTEWH